MLVALMCLWAGCALVQLFEHPALGAALKFALIASAAILTKGTAMALAMVPVIFLLLTRKWEMLKTRAFWSAGALVALFAGPWTAYSIHTSSKTWNYEVGWTYTFLAAKVFSRFLVDAVGPLLFIVAAYGVLHVVFLPVLQGRSKPIWIMLFAVLVSTYVFQLIVPVSVEQRYLMAAFPCLAAFVVAGLSDLLERLRNRGAPRRVQALVVCGVLVAGLLGMRKPEKLSPTGFRSMVAHIVQQYSRYPKVAVLVCSDSTGEGVVVSELAARAPKPGKFFVLRASKVLARMDWVGRGYSLLFDNDQEVREYLESVPVTLILVDHSVDSVPIMKQDLQVESILAQPRGGIWQRDPRGGSAGSRRLELYAIEPNQYRLPAHIRVDMEIMLGRELVSGDE
jgi:hypothetical protein